MSTKPKAPTPVAVPHDAREAAQFVFRARGSSLGLLTDLGTVTPHIEEHFGDCDALLLEANHDPQMLAQMVASLVGNAYQHGARQVEVSMSDRASIHPTFAVGASPDPAVYVSVVDDGPGISPEFAPRMFEKFEKDSFSSGTGLGLYLVRLMAEETGCRVAVESSPTGTVFEIAVPLAQTAAEMVVA